MIEENNGNLLGGWDVGVIAIYFVIVMCVGLWSSRQSKRDSMSGYFLASRNMHWLQVGCSVYVSNIGAQHFIGLAGTASATGIGIAGFELWGIFPVFLLGWFFVPVYMSAGVYTMPEYLKKRFGGQRIRLYIAFLSLLLYIFSKISADLYAGALFIKLALNKSSDEWLYISIVFLLAVAALFTMVGGLTAVIWTDFIQTIIMLIGAFILMIIALHKVGGYQQLLNSFPYTAATIRAGNGTCGLPPKDYNNLLRSPHPGESDLPWTGFLFLVTLSIWYFCCDQVIVQRTLASKNMIHAKAGCVLAAALKLLPLYLMVLPGMAARILYADRVACADPEECIKVCGSPGGCSNIAYAELVLKLLPPGLSGLMIAVMLAALMTSLTSIFNSASAIFTIDIWSRFRKNASSMELLIVGRLSVLVLAIVSILWIPVIKFSGTTQLFVYMNIVLSLLGPPMTAVFLLAIFWERTNEPGAFWGLIVGLAVGLTRFLIEFSFSKPPCGIEDPISRPQLIKLLLDNLHFLHFSAVLFLITLVVTVSVSLLTKPIPKECTRRLTFWSRHDPRVRKELEETEEQENNVKSNLESFSEVTEREDSSASKIFSRICCFSSNPEKDGLSDEHEKSEEIQAREAAEFLYENPKHKLIVDWAAVACLVLTVFSIGFYA